MIEPTIELVFPTPVMFTKLDREFTKNEIKFVKKHSDLSHGQEDIKDGDYGVSCSVNKYILNEPEFADLHKYITEAVNLYSKKVYKPKHDNEIFITQSWLNWLKPGQSHHKHCHTNSFISGVLYINADINKDRIYVYRGQYNQLEIPSDNFDVLNSNTWFFEVGTKDIIMFPSSIMHGVNNTTSNKPRISLAFNTFIKGTIGDYDSATEIIYKS